MNYLCSSLSCTDNENYSISIIMREAFQFSIEELSYGCSTLYLSSDIYPCLFNNGANLWVPPVGAISLSDFMDFKHIVVLFLFNIHFLVLLTFFSFEVQKSSYFHARYKFSQSNNRMKNDLSTSSYC